VFNPLLGRVVEQPAANILKKSSDFGIRSGVNTSVGPGGEDRILRRSVQITA